MFSTNHRSRPEASVRRRGAAVAVAIAWLLAAGIAEARSAATATEGPDAVALVASELKIPSPRGEIAATLTRPAGSQRSSVVLILHGYTGDRNETAVSGTHERMFQRTARMLGEKGLATLRFDFINSGQSGGRWRNTTFSGQVADVVTVLDFVAREPMLDPRRIGLLGYSQGGLVALKAAAGRPGIAAVVLWNPVLDPERTYDRLLGARAIQLGYDMYRMHDVERLVGGSALLPAFMYEVRTTYPMADGSDYPGPILIVGGRRDRVAGPVDAYGQLLARLRGARQTELVMIDGDHGFDHAKSPINLDAAIGRSAAFLAPILASDE